jgi:hypothetical protein
MASKLSEGTTIILQGGAPGQGVLPERETREKRAQQRAISRAQQRVISQGLRQFFDTVVSEPIPDEFVELLKRIDEEKNGRSV